MLVLCDRADGTGHRHRATIQAKPRLAITYVLPRGGGGIPVTVRDSA